MQIIIDFDIKNLVRIIMHSLPFPENFTIGPFCPKISPAPFNVYFLLLCLSRGAQKANFPEPAKTLIRPCTSMLFVDPKSHKSAIRFGLWWSLVQISIQIVREVPLGPKIYDEIHWTKFAFHNFVNLTANKKHPSNPCRTNTSIGTTTTYSSINHFVYRFLPLQENSPPFSRVFKQLICPNTSCSLALPTSDHLPLSPSN
jgi:hypothetical protein